MIIVLLGPPASGKGTIAQEIEEKKGWKHISTGDLLRDEAEKPTERGKKLAEVMKTGNLVPDETVTETLKEFLQEHDLKSFILDGYPRTPRQAELLDQLLESRGQKVDLVLRLKCLNKTIIERISSRRVCPQCHAVYGLNIPPKEEGKCDHCGSALIQREDEKPETVLKRIKVYANVTKPLIDYYEEKGLVKEVNASLSLEEVFAQAFKALE
jgi:adenylate kinase